MATKDEIKYWENLLPQISSENDQRQIRRHIKELKEKLKPRDLLKDMSSEAIKASIEEQHRLAEGWNARRKISLRKGDHGDADRCKLQITRIDARIDRMVEEQMTRQKMMSAGERTNKPHTCTPVNVAFSENKDDEVLICKICERAM